VKQRLLWIAAVVIAGMGACGLRVVLEGRSALAEGDAALAAGRPADAVAAWESAARWYLPGAPHVGEAYDRLHELATTHKSLAAWRAIRSAARATRHLWQPHGDRLAAADTAITELAAADAERAPAGGPDPAKFSTWHATRLAGDPRPSAGSAALAIAGIVCWLAGMALLIRRQTRIHGNDRGDEGSPLPLTTLLHPGPRLALVIAVAGVALWALGLYTA
jgi:hypothetical protein